MKADTKWLRMERTVNAPIADVWAMWTRSELFSQWYGPNGMTIPVAEMDVRPGGRRKICMDMKMPDRTMTMWFSGEYIDVTEPTRLAYTESMCDADGNLIDPQTMGMPAGHPEVTEIIVELEDVGGKTQLTLTHVGVLAGSRGAGGWAQAIEKLVGLVEAG
jgi:uncharacterized protein YndB with AHSA1/START domain